MFTFTVMAGIYSYLCRIWYNGSCYAMGNFCSTDDAIAWATVRVSDLNDRYAF